jgi:hypothetical protein
MRTENLTSLLGRRDHPRNCGISVSPHEAPNKAVDPVASYDQVSLLDASICEDHLHTVVGFNDVHHASVDSHLGFVRKLLVQDFEETSAL